MQTFANQFRFDEYDYPVDSKHDAVYIPRSNFDTLLWSMVTVFQILTGENWNVVMQDGWRSTGWSAVTYFVSLVVLGNFTVLNLFLAILLGNFEESSDDERKDARKEMKKKSRVTPVQTWRPEREGGNTLNYPEDERAIPHHVHAHSMTSMGKSRREGSASPSKIFQDQSFSSMRMSSARKDIPSKLTDRSLLIFTLENPIRKASTLTITHPHFDNVSLVLIAVSTVALAIDNPLNPPDSTFVCILSWLDSILTGLFMFEVAVKIIALGFFMDENAYLRNGWNLMDFVITTLAAFSLSEGSTRFKFVKTLRTFRALRPLRMINRNPGLKLVVSSLIASIPQILNVIVVCLLVFTIFSILAVNNLKGKLSSCQGEVFDALSEAQQRLVTYPRLWSNLTDDEQAWFNANSATAYENFSASDQVTSRVICGLLGATWGAAIPQNLNNVLQGCQAFFEMTTTEGWVTIMLAGVDATEIDMQPIPNYREGWTLFFIAFILVGTFFVMQLFVGVVIKNFNKMKEKLDETYLLSNTQREWLIINDSMLNLRPMRKMKAPQDKTRRVLFHLARNHNLEIVVMGCIMLNTMMMALNYFGEGDMYKSAIEYSNYVFAFIFTMEAAVKITGLGRYYWKDSWNIFDFVIVSGSLLGMLYTWIGGSSVGTAAGAVRSFRTGRLFRLVQSAPSLRQLFNTLLITLPSLVNIGGLLFLIFFIYAAMGVQLFAKVEFGDLVTPTANFQTIARAMVTLVRCATGERWNDLMYELSSQDDCVEDPPYNPEMCGFNNTIGCTMLNGCGSPVAYAYLYSFTLLVTFILLNIFIAVILEGFANEKDRADGLLLPHHYENFIEMCHSSNEHRTTPHEVSSTIRPVFLHSAHITRNSGHFDLLIVNIAEFPRSESNEQLKMAKKAPSARSLFRRDTASMSDSPRSNKSDDLRKESHTVTNPSRMESRRGSWMTLFRGLTQQNLTISRTFQKRAYSNADALVASLEVVIVVLSMIQLELSLRSPRWRENRACLGAEGCSTLLDEGSFKIVNALRMGIVVLSLIRAWIRVRYLRNKRSIFMATSEKSIRVRLSYVTPYFVELLFTITIPYPVLEHVVPREHPSIIVCLAVATVIRTVYWRHLLFFPYPIRQKEKVAWFTGNLEFTYREFVLKKVFDDDPITKIVMIYTVTLALASFLLHVVESVYGACAWQLGASTDNAGNVICYNLTWNDSVWVVATAFLSTGYGDLLPRSSAGRVIVSVAIFAMKLVSALFFSIIIKKNKFSTMEARVHSFLFRMELNERKDRIAVMAVQATFRFNKSYKQSLIWHQQDQSRLYFRPLSARLPNEVKKKLYVSRFQASLKDIMKYNTDGDLLNTFTKHIEVITVALGISYARMVSL
ncbi:Voltage-gated ion channel, partial [Globisporangium splendens]